MAHRPTLAAQKGHALYPIRLAGAMRGTLFRPIGLRMSHVIGAGTAATRTLRGLLAASRPSVTMPTFAGPSVALLAGAMPSIRTPFVSPPSFALASVAMPCALRALAGAAWASLALL